MIWLGGASRRIKSLEILAGNGSLRSTVCLVILRRQELTKLVVTGSKADLPIILLENQATIACIRSF